VRIRALLLAAACALLAVIVIASPALAVHFDM